MTQLLSNQITAYDFNPGRILAKKYQVVNQIGSGWEGEVYMLHERQTGIERAAKFFFPHRNQNNKASNFYAKKLHKLRHCDILIKYHTQETIVYRGQPITFLVSDFVEGSLLSDYIAAQPGKRLALFEAMHLLYALARGMEEIHNEGEYHGDLHPENIFVQKHGLGFKIKLIDLFHWGAPKAENIHDDVCDLIRIFYDCIGGSRFYSKMPQEAKAICCGLRRSLIIKKFRTAGKMRAFLENMPWS